MNDGGAILKKLGDIGLVPVIKLEAADQALPLGQALCKGNLPVAEVTFRTDAAEDSIRILSSELPELIVGAGTVLSTEQADRAISAGARFIVTPGFNPEVVRYCIDRGVPIIPGVMSPSQIEQALCAGLDIVKFFPAEQAGGVAMLKAFAGPYGGKISFIPTGGVDVENLAHYLCCPNVHAVGGSWMTPADALAEGAYDRIETLCAEARSRALGFVLRHIGINPGGVDRPMDNARLLASALGMPFIEGLTSAFIGTGFEIMKNPGRGEHGHIAIQTLSVERALAWFATFGIAPIEETIIRKGGKISFAYLDRPFMGFALHLNRK